MPKGVSFDIDGNLLIGQQDLVRKINKLTGIISTVAGDATALTLGDGGPATDALLVSPYAVCVDKVGNLYIADYWSNTVRKVTVSTGVIDKFAGTGSVGNAGDGGPATTATFNSLGCICIDTTRGYMYISCTYNHRIRRVDLSTGIITAFAGTGVNGYFGDGSDATNARLSRTLGICLDHGGNLYIGDWDNGRIRKVDISTGIISTIAGNGTLGFGGDSTPATNAMLSKPTAICFDSCGNLYFSDEDNNRVRKIDVITGIITTVAGKGTAGFSGDDSLTINASFNHPTGVCIDRSGNLYVGDYYNQRVRKVKFDTLCLNGSPTLNINRSRSTLIISIYPNPTNEILNIDNVKSPATYHLVSMVGAVMQRGRLKEGSNSISVQSLPAGMYMLEVVSDGGDKVVRKVVRE